MTDMIGGSGGGSGGSVVQSTDPMAALQAGQIGARAAQEATQAARDALNSAINAVNQNYQQARYDVQPYRTAGVAALDQLNQYMGLPAFNPGDAPVKPTMQSVADKLGITPGTIANYVNSNRYKSQSIFAQSKDDNVVNQGTSIMDPITGQTFYLGALAGQNTGFNNMAQQPNAQQFLQSAATGGVGNVQYNNGQLEKNVTQYLANPQYQQDLAAYNANLPEWQQNKDLYDQYTSEGPLTAAQVADKISNLPGYQAQLDQGTNAISKDSSAKGYLGSGRVLKELMSFGQNTLSQFYGQEMSRLAGIAGMGQQSAAQTATSANQNGNALASLYQSFGDTAGNAALAAGKAQSDALTNANQQFNVVGQQSGSNLGGLGTLLGGVGSLYDSGIFSKAVK